jgi:hypothetical protein
VLWCVFGITLLLRLCIFFLMSIAFLQRLLLFLIFFKTFRIMFFLQLICLINWCGFWRNLVGLTLFGALSFRLLFIWFCGVGFVVIYLHMIIWFFVGSSDIVYIIGAIFVKIVFIRPMRWNRNLLFCSVVWKNNVLYSIDLLVIWLVLFILVFLI